MKQKNAMQGSVKRIGCGFVQDLGQIYPGLLPSYHCLPTPRGGGSLSTLVKPVSHLQEKNQSLTTPPWGSRIAPISGQFSDKRLKTKAQIFSLAPGFLRTPPPPPGGGGGLWPSQSLLKKKPVTHPQGLSNGMAPIHVHRRAPFF